MGTPTANNREEVSQALKDAATAFLATVGAHRPAHRYKFGKPAITARPANWTPTPLKTTKKNGFALGKATSVKALSRAELQSLRTIKLPAVLPSVEDLAMRRQLRTDNEDTSVKPPLVWKDKTPAVETKRTFPQDLGKPMVISPAEATATNGGGKPTPQGKRGKAQKRASTDETPAEPTEPAEKTVQEAENVWKRTKEVLLKDPTTKKPSSTAIDEIKYAEHYAVARRSDYRTMPKGYHRRMTQLEEETLFLWLAQVIFLAEPPKFMTETHSLEERLAFWETHRRRKFKLFVETPPQLKWPAATATFHFCTALVDKNHASGDDAFEVLEDIHVITCSADSRMAVLHFVRPDTRDKWTNRSFKFPFGQITLRATDTLDHANKKDGLDAAGLALMYPIHLLGRPGMALSDVHAIATELSGGLPILDVYPLESTGARALETHEWRIVLHGTEAPTGIAQLRCLNITQGDNHFRIGVHQPRLERRHPCSICLGIGHYRNKCQHKGNDAKIAEIRARFERDLVLPETKEFETEPAAATLEEHRAQMERIRQRLAPELAAKDAAERLQREETEKAEREAAAEAAAAREAAAALERQLKQEEAKAAAQRLRKEKAKAKASKSPVQLLSAALRRKPSKKKSTTPPSAVTGSAKDSTADDQPAKSHSISAPFVAPTSPTERWRGAIAAMAATDADGVSTGKRKRVEGLLSLTADVFADTQMDTEDEEGEQHQRFLKSADGSRVAGHDSKKAQAMVTAFFPRQPADDVADTQSSSDVEMLQIVPAPDRPVHAPALLSGLGMSPVGTPMNGSCLLHALLTALSLVCGSQVDATDATEKRVTLELRRDLYQRLCEELRNLLAIGSLTLPGLVSMYLDASHKSAEPDTQFRLLLQHFRDAGNLNSLSVSREFWGGEAEITAFVEWKREPLYVLDVWPSGATFAIRYELTDVIQDDGTSKARVITVSTPIETFRAQIAVYKSQQVIPLVILCHHTWVDGPNGAASGHFTAARLPNSSYAAWCGSEEKRRAMRVRLNRVEAIILNMRETGETEAPEPSTGSPDEASEWRLGDSVAGSSDGSSLIEASASVGAAPFTTALSSIADVAAVAHHAEADGDALMPAAPAASQPEESIESELSSILSTQPDPGLSFSAIDRLMPASFVKNPGDSNYVDEEALLQAQERVKVTDPQAKHALKTVDKVTQVAYSEWVRRQAKESPQLHALVKKEKTSLLACSAVCDRPDFLRALLRALPYPEVIVAQLKVSVLATAGKHIICAARVQLLYRLQAYLDEDERGFCQEWATSIASSMQLKVKWSLAQDESKWGRLERLAAKVKQPLPAREPVGVDINQWVRLVAFLLVVPGNVPNYFQVAGFPMQSDALLVWMQREGNTAVVISAAHALEHRRWLEVTEVIRHWQGQVPRLSVTATVAHSGAAGGVAPRY